MLINTPHSPFYTNLCRQTFCYPNNTMEYNIVLHAAMQWWIRKGQDCFFGIWKYGAHDRWKGYFRVFERDRNILGRWVHAWCIPRIVIGKTDPWIVLPSIWKQKKTKQTTTKKNTDSQSHRFRWAAGILNVSAESASHWPFYCHERQCRLFWQPATFPVTIKQSVWFLHRGVYICTLQYNKHIGLLLFYCVLFGI